MFEAVLFGRQRSGSVNECPRQTSEYDAVITFCSTLHCPERIGDACLRALPASEASPDHLARLILAKLITTNKGDCTSVGALRRLVRERSQDDFGRDRTVNVDGWMLSLTETRIYALSALLANKPRQMLIKNINDQH